MGRLDGHDSSFPGLQALQLSTTALVSVPVLTKEAFALLTGIPLGVLSAQFDRGMWGPPFRVGKRALVNMEFVRLQALKQAQEFI